MAEEKVKQTKIDELIPDDKNFNKGTEYGNSLIEKSLRKFGAGRSVLIDKNNRIIAGNKTIENASAIGLDDVIVVETDGKKIVAVKRTDIDLDSKEGRELALADNQTSAVNFSIDEDVLKDVSDELEIDLGEWGVVNLGEGLNLDAFWGEGEIKHKERGVIIEVVLPKDLEDKVADIKSIIEVSLIDYNGIKVKQV